MLGHYIHKSSPLLLQSNCKAIWNYMPVIDILCHQAKSHKIFMEPLVFFSILTNLVHIITSVHATDVQDSQPIQLFLTVITVTDINNHIVNYIS